MSGPFKKRKIYSTAGWKWLLQACARHKSLMEMAELTHIILKGD
jgi:hypothetical protein